MPIAIIIAILVALFSLGTKMNQPKGSPAQVVIVGGKYYQVDKKDNRNTLVEMSPEKPEHSITIQSESETVPFDNVFFQLSGIIK